MHDDDNDSWNATNALWSDLLTVDRALTMKLLRKFTGSGLQEKRGRKPGQRSEPPAADVKRRMRDRAAFLLPEVKSARKLPARQAVQRLQELATSKIPGLSRRMPAELGIFHERSTNTYHVGTKAPKEIVIWIIAAEFKISQPNTKTILSGIR